MTSQSSLLDNISQLGVNSSAASSPVPSSLPPEYRDTSVPLNATPTEIALKRTSEIWDHSFWPRNEIHRDRKGRSIWKCLYCSQDYVDTGTSNARTHLKLKHSNEVATHHKNRVGGYQQQIDFSKARVKSQQTNYKRRKLDGEIEDPNAEEQGQRDIDPAVLEDLYVAWITACGISFEMVTRDEFRA